MARIYHMTRHGEWVFEWNNYKTGKWIDDDTFYYDGWHFWLKIGKFNVFCSY